jgi:hypothetical protein
MYAYAAWQESPGRNRSSLQARTPMRLHYLILAPPSTLQKSWYAVNSKRSCANISGDGIGFAPGLAIYSHLSGLERREGSPRYNLLLAHHRKAKVLFLYAGLCARKWVLLYA